MQQVSAQTAGLSFEPQRRMDHSGKARFVSPVEPPLKIRIPARMMDPRAKVPGKACHFVNSEFRRALLPLQQGIAQFAAQLFIGVKQEYPIVPGAGGRIVLLIRVVGEGPFKEGNDARLRNFHSAVLAP